MIAITASTSISEKAPILRLVLIRIGLCSDMIIDFLLLLPIFRKSRNATTSPNYSGKGISQWLDP
jgi:hypothetical protein